MTDSSSPDHGFKTAADGHTYHKSKTANAPVAPTNAATLASVLPKLPMDELDFITIVDYHFGLNGEVPTNDFLETEYGYSNSQIKTYYKNPAITAELIKRGVPLIRAGVINTEEHPVPSLRGKLEPLQLKAANRILDLTDTKSDRKKLQDIGVSSQQYEAWKRDPNFREYIGQRAEAMIGDMQHDAMIALADNVKSGKMDAIKFYLEFTGKYVPQSASQSNQAGSQAPVDFQMMIVRIIEILDEELEDPEVALKISKRLKALVSGQQLVNGLLAQPDENQTVQPEIAKPRELTPKVQEMMQRGLGYDS